MTSESNMEVPAIGSKKLEAHYSGHIWQVKHGKIIVARIDPALKDNGEEITKLFATAPKMAKALEKALTCMDSLQKVQKWDRETGATINEAMDARDAIKVALIESGYKFKKAKHEHGNPKR